MEYVNRNVDILGSIWTISVAGKKDDPKLETVTGYADPSVKKIVVCNFDDEKDGELAIEDVSRVIRKVLRHEIIHAFLQESGFDGNEYGCEHWSENEEMIDWFAMQLPKIVEACQEAGCIMK